MDKKAMLKQAAQLLREQQAEIKDLHEKQARDQKAEQIVQKLIDNDELLAENVLQKLSELRAKTMQDLEVMEKAAEMFHSALPTLGNLSDIPAGISSNPLIEYLFSE